MGLEAPGAFALRQRLSAAADARGRGSLGYIEVNPAKLAGKNPQPAPRAVRVYTLEELEAISAELEPRYRPLPTFAASTGLRPEEWAALERRDVDRSARVLTVRRTISSGEIVELGKTTRSRRQIPLSARALEALEDLPPRLDSPYVVAAARGGPCDLANFRNRVWRPAVVTAGITQPARLYDLRSTFASNALAAGVTVFELARLMGTSTTMIERHYGTLVEGRRRHRPPAGRLRGGCVTPIKRPLWGAPPGLPLSVHSCLHYRSWASNRATGGPHPCMAGTAPGSCNASRNGGTRSVLAPRGRATESRPNARPLGFHLRYPQVSPMGRIDASAPPCPGSALIRLGVYWAWGSSAQRRIRLYH